MQNESNQGQESAKTSEKAGTQSGLPSRPEIEPSKDGKPGMTGPATGTPATPPIETETGGNPNAKDAPLPAKNPPLPDTKQKDKVQNQPAGNRTSAQAGTDQAQTETKQKEDAENFDRSVKNAVSKKIDGMKSSELIKLVRNKLNKDSGDGKSKNMSLAIAKLEEVESLIEGRTEVAE